uniref:Putative ovule protein n=1 Tax=Solanum chacoense TaxID=4108 RepID=A0A0V0GP71_SOLCH
MLLKMLKEDGSNLPTSYYNAKKIIRELGFSYRKLMHVRIIACCIGRMMRFLNLAKYVEHLDGRRINVIGKQNLGMGKRYHARFCVIFL